MMEFSVSASQTVFKKEKITNKVKVPGPKVKPNLHSLKDIMKAHGSEV